MLNRELVIAGLQVVKMEASCVICAGLRDCSLMLRQSDICAHNRRPRCVKHNSADRMRNAGRLRKGLLSGAYDKHCNKKYHRSYCVTHECALKHCSESRKIVAWSLRRHSMSSRADRNC